MSCKSFNRVVVNREALRHNYRILQQRSGADVPLLAMVKADGYGHGMAESAAVLSDVGCQGFGVAEVDEGVCLRASGIKGDIFVFLGFPESSVTDFFTYQLTPVIYSMESGVLLSREAVKLGQKIGVHLKVDCGMSRLGVFPAEVASFTAGLSRLPGIDLKGMASHFPRADEPGSSHSAEQCNRFTAAVACAAEEGTLLTHIANSGGILYFPKSRCAMVRSGISLYGYYPDGTEGVRRESGEKLRPVMEFSSCVLQVKTLPKGTGVSYGHTYTTSEETTLAVLPIGYEDGFSRSLSNVGEVLIHGQRAKVCGRVCMNLCMVDVTSIEGVRAGDEVVILGAQGTDRITADEIAGWMGSISYEVLCLFGNNNDRSYRE